MMMSSRLMSIESVIFCDEFKKLNVSYFTTFSKVTLVLIFADETTKFVAFV